jgi:predicted metal-dependent hydrolase
MYPPHQKRFVDESTKAIQGQLAKMGVIIRRPEELKDTVLKIGKRYHELKKIEEI